MVPFQTGANNEAYSATPGAETKTPARIGVSLYYRTWRGNTLQFCPACLAEDAVPYFRRSWRLAFVTLCARHGRRLLDRCAACRAPLRFELISLEAASLAVCYRCASDLRAAPATRVKAGQLTERVIQFQERLLRVVEG